MTQPQRTKPDPELEDRRRGLPPDDAPNMPSQRPGDAPVDVAEREDLREARRRAEPERHDLARKADPPEDI